QPASKKSIAEILEGVDLSKPGERERVVAEMRKLQESRKTEAERIAKEKGWPIRAEAPNGSVREIADLDEHGNPIYFMDNSSAEMAKYAANAFLAMKISFINELATLSEKVGADIQEVRKALVSDSRIGNKFLYAGCGYGGSCFPKDVQGLIHVGNQFGMPLQMFRAVHEVNEKQKLVIFEKIKKHFKSDLKGKTVAVWGMSFKPMTDDMREAPAVSLINALLEASCKVKAYDPVAKHEASKLFEGRIEICSDAYEAVKGTDALAIMTEWNEFRSPDFEFLKKNLKHPVLFDGRNLFNPESIKAYGLHYYCIGRPDPIV
ncbi:MAG: UDP-glucose/GDP-mannose dehydrogenase family protein, partial [Proteobacteria bacterium]|nr:UDP-glucose/GDP-mannose dehydrogenase family protein [Pseudomonadota bacterium]